MKIKEKKITKIKLPEGKFCYDKCANCRHAHYSNGVYVCDFYDQVVDAWDGCNSFEPR